jgi:hypothetical protein
MHNQPTCGHTGPEAGNSAGVPAAIAREALEFRPRKLDSNITLSSKNPYFDTLLHAAQKAILA